MGRFKLFIPLLVFAVVVGFFYSTIDKISEGEYNPQTLPSALVNKPVPKFDLPTVENAAQRVTNKQLLGSIALINVWATWCPSCHIEHGYLNYLKQQGVVIFGINYKDDRAAANQWLTSKGDPYQINIFDEQGRLGLDMGVTGAPETYLIDHRGFVRMRYQGPVDENVWQQKFVPLIEQLQREQQGDSPQQVTG
mgnify:FL=1